MVSRGVSPLNKTRLATPKNRTKVTKSVEKSPSNELGRIKKHIEKVCLTGVISKTSLGVPGMPKISTPLAQILRDRQS